MADVALTGMSVRFGQYGLVQSLPQRYRDTFCFPYADVPTGLAIPTQGVPPGGRPESPSDNEKTRLNVSGPFHILGEFVSTFMVCTSVDTPSVRVWLKGHDVAMNMSPTYQSPTPQSPAV